MKQSLRALLEHILCVHISHQTKPGMKGKLKYNILLNEAVMPHQITHQ